jgi:multiple sugar transport system permease protein
MRKRRRRVRVLVYVGLLPFVLFAVLPFYWMAVTSVKTDAETYDLRAVPFVIRHGVTWAHYAFLVQQTPFLLWYRNTVIVSLLATLGSATVAVLAAYSIVRIRFPGSDPVALGTFLTYLVPPTLLFVPLSEVVGRLHLIDSYWALVLTYPTFIVPLCTWLLIGYFRSIPTELEDSALVDGATRLGALVRIVLPVAVPGVLTTVLLGFTLSWGNLIYPLAFTASTPQKVLTVGLLTELVRGDVFYWGSLMAGALLASVPVVVAYSFFTSYFVSGWTAGATKG